MGKWGIHLLHILCTSLSAVIATGEWCLLWGSLDVRPIFNPNALCYLESPWCCCTLRCLRLCLTLKKGRGFGPSGLHFWISRAPGNIWSNAYCLLLSCPQVAACQKNKNGRSLAALNTGDEDVEMGFLVSASDVALQQDFVNCLLMNPVNPVCLIWLPCPFPDICIQAHFLPSHC